ncbi:hypothetical protein [Dyella sp. ASV21]|uniref:hypothetical protein n=1 Tax=Dyella sp. ASV21 TaxID=2795114 RepID=UPI0018EDAEDE|nr:hypothetical protein [Dyella sp. ASV21]
MTKQSNKHPDGAGAGTNPSTDGQTPFVPSPEAVQAYQAFEAELFKREVSNAEAYDKAVLLYSTGALGLSLTFIKDIVPAGKAVCLWALYASWGGFLAAMIIVLISYLVGQKAIRRQRDLAYEVYCEGEQDKAKPEHNHWSAWTDYLNVGSGACFVLGVALMTWFVANNVAQREDPAALAYPTSQPTGSTTITLNDAPIVASQPPSEPQLNAPKQPPRAATNTDSRDQSKASR